jgi:hypothetical protein
LVAPHPGVRRIELGGSRAEGRAEEWSDWDFVVDAADFELVAEALPRLLEPLHPVVQQWDPLSAEQCWMAILPGPVKVDLIFPDEPHRPQQPWPPNADNLAAIDAHFWDWTLWLRGKERHGRSSQVEDELRKLFEHLLEPLGAEAVPNSVAEAVLAYRHLRSRAEERYGRSVPRGLEEAVAPALRA